MPIAYLDHFLPEAVRVKTMGKIKLRMFVKVRLDLHPVAAVIAHFFSGARCARG